MKTVDRLLEETGLVLEELAERSGLTLARVEAIAVGRWTPSPDERRKLATVFAVEVEEISWGHSIDPRNLRYRRFGFQDKIQDPALE